VAGCKAFEQVFDQGHSNKFSKHLFDSVSVSLSECFQPNLGIFQPNPKNFEPNPDRIFAFIFQPNLGLVCCLVWHYKIGERQLVGCKGHQD
jgi:hypothetical protein